ALADAVENLVRAEEEVIDLAAHHQSGLVLGEVAARDEPGAERRQVAGGAGLGAPALEHPADLRRTQQAALGQQVAGGLHGLRIHRRFPCGYGLAGAFGCHSHSLMPPPQDTTVLPSGETATARTGPLCSADCATSLPCASQTRTVASSPPVT